MQEVEPAQTNTDSHEQRHRPKLWGKVLCVIVLLLLLGLIGFLLWQLKLCQDEHTKDAADKQSLTAKVADLTKQLADADKSSDSSPAPAAAAPCSPQKEITATLKENLAAAISSKNTAALKGYMADKVNVVFAASEKGGDEAPDQAIADLDYVNSNATGPWDFNLSAATLNGFKAGFYKQYFQDPSYVGQSANKYVVSYGFDTCAKINRIFVSASADLL